VDQNKGYCRQCDTCTLNVTRKVICQNNLASIRFLSISNVSCSNCTGTTCNICTDSTGNNNKGYDCTGCTLNTSNKNIGYCLYCNVCTPVLTYASCPNNLISIARVILNATSCSGCSGTKC
jgi:hypothetical protein